MNKRIRKKVAIRKCKKSLETMKNIFLADCEQGKDTEEFIGGLEAMYARRMNTIKKKY